MDTHAAALPCSMPACERPLGHLSACTSPSSCPGCLNLCAKHVDWLLEDAAALPALLSDLAQVLASITSEGISLRESVVDARSAIVGSLSEIVSALQEEHALPPVPATKTIPAVVDPPEIAEKRARAEEIERQHWLATTGDGPALTDDQRAEYVSLLQSLHGLPKPSPAKTVGLDLYQEMASWVRHHIEYLAVDPYGPVMAQTIRHRVTEGRRLAYAVHHRGVRLGECPLTTATDVTEGTENEGTENEGTENPDQDENDSHCGGAVIFETCAPGKRPEATAWCTRCGTRQPVPAWREAGLEPSYRPSTAEVTKAIVLMETGETVTSKQLMHWRQRGQIRCTMIGQTWRERYDAESEGMVPCLGGGQALYHPQTVIERVRSDQRATRAAAIRAACRLPQEERYAALMQAIPEPGPIAVALMEIVAQGKRWDATAEQVIALLEGPEEPEEDSRPAPETVAA